MTTPTTPDEMRARLVDELRKTETPSVRVAVAMGFAVYIKAILKTAMTSSQLSEEALRMVNEWASQLQTWIDNPSSSFVDVIAMLYRESERLQNESSDRVRAAAPEIRAWLHELAFSPPVNCLSPDAGKMAEDLHDFAVFVKEFNEETDRGAALVGAALVDSRLESLLREHLLNNKITATLFEPDGSLGSFGSRMRMCYALGLITKIEYLECNNIRRVRDEFAHRLHGLTFEDQQISDWCRNLKAMGFAMESDTRRRFVNSVITLCMVLWYRPAHAAAFKAQERKWAWHLADL